MYYTANYWAALLDAEAGRLLAYQAAVAKPQSDSNRSQEIKAADTEFERIMREASRAADAELSAVSWAALKQHVLEEAAMAPELELKRRAEAELRRRAAKEQEPKEKLEFVVRQVMD